MGILKVLFLDKGGFNVHLSLHVYDNCNHKAGPILSKLEVYINVVLLYR